MNSQTAICHSLWQSVFRCQYWRQILQIQICYNYVWSFFGFICSLWCSSSSIWQLERSTGSWKNLNLVLSSWLEDAWRNNASEVELEDRKVLCQVYSNITSAGIAYMEVDTTTYLSIRKVLKVTKIQCFLNVSFQNRLRQWTKRCVSCFK